MPLVYAVFRFPIEIGSLVLLYLLRKNHSILMLDGNVLGFGIRNGTILHPASHRSMRMNHAVHIYDAIGDDCVFWIGSGKIELTNRKKKKYWWIHSPPPTMYEQIR